MSCLCSDRDDCCPDCSECRLCDMCICDDLGIQNHLKYEHGGQQTANPVVKGTYVGWHPSYGLVMRSDHLDIDRPRPTMARLNEISGLGKEFAEECTQVIFLGLNHNVWTLKNGRAG